MTKCTITLVAATLLLAGCDTNPLGTVNAPTNTPYLSSARVLPDSVNIDALPSTNGVVTVTTTITARLATSEAVSPVATVYYPASRTPVLSVNMLDNGVSPDAAGGDSVFTAILQFTATRSDAGLYTVEVQATSPSGLSGNSLDLTLKVARRNSPPQLSNLSAPDTVTLPVGGSIGVFMSVAATDSDGLADIRQVYFRSLTSSNPDFKFFLKDDGSADPAGQFGIPSGDLVPGDGVFSVIVPLVDGQAQRRTNIFAFQAVDSFGDTSATIIHYLTVQ